MLRADMAVGKCGLGEIGLVRGAVAAPNPERRLSEIRSQWRECIKALDAGQPLAPFRIWGECGLSLFARLRLVWITSDLTVERFASEVFLGSDTVERAISLGDAARATDNTVETFLTFQNGRRGGALPLTLRDFKDEWFAGREAIDDVLAWIEGSPPRLRTRDELLAKKNVGRLLFAPGSKRDEEIGRIERFINAQDSRPILVVHQHGMATGLTALAKELCARSTQDATAIKLETTISGKSICYLPLGREPTSETRVSYPMLVAYLKAFYAGTSLEHARPVRSVRELRADVELIRRRMSTEPAILLFDGHRGNTSALPHLAAAITDDPLTSILNDIANPYVGDLQDAIAGTFYKTRILIFADRDVPLLQTLCSPSISFPLPLSGDMPSLLAGQSRKHSEEIAALCRERQALRSDAALDALELIIDLRLQGENYDRASLISELAGGALKGLVRLVVEELARSRPVALLLLRLAALTHTGLRFTTLERIFRDLGNLLEALPEVPAIWKPDTSLTADALATEAVRLGRLVHLGPEEETPGLDTSFNAQDRMAVELRTAEVRDALIDDLFATQPHEILIIIHRLFAEELLEQQTAIMRNGDWRDGLNSRFYRRLYQGLFHGFQSLSLGPGNQFGSLAKVRHVLPSDATRSFRRLYAVFYRMLLERPPHWELSRVLARDSIKADLLLLAMNSGRRSSLLWGRSDARRLRPVRSVFTQANDSPHTERDMRAAMAMALDQSLALARSLFQLNDLKRVEEATAVGRSLIEAGLSSAASASSAPREFARYSTGLTKTRLDDEILRSAPDISETTMEAICAALDEVGFDEMWRHRLNRIGAELRVDDGDVEKLLERKTNDLVREWQLGKSSSELAACSDFLCRLAEVAALKADAGGDRVDLASDFLASFIQFSAAEKLRRGAFEADPLGREFAVNGHSTRVLVRVGLQLVKAHDEALRDRRADVLARIPPRDYFVGQVRRHIDVLTRYFTRYPSERPSVLIVESQFVRIVGAGADRALADAQRLLARADEMMWGTNDRPRVRLRLLLERSKVLRDRASLIKDDGERQAIARKFCEFAIYDSIRLSRLAEDLSRLSEGAPVEFWRYLARRSRNSITILCGAEAFQGLGAAGLLSNWQ